MRDLQGIDRRTTTDLVFDHLREEIVHMRLLPGTKLSEAEIARRFGVSRQPVRDAFNRLSNMELVIVRPQRATEVRGFSLASIEETRFIRASVEFEVIRRACQVWGEAADQALQENLVKQRAVIAAKRDDKFHTLDTQFHRLVCELGGCPQALDTISRCRQKIDRLCLLSMGKQSETDGLLQDHEQLAAALLSGATDEAIAITKRHLGRLDGTITDIHQNHSQYFEDSD